MPLYGMLLDNMPRIYMKDMFLFNINTSNQVILVRFQNTERIKLRSDPKVWEKQSGGKKSKCALVRN